jgi:site-specific recombinase XerD
MSTTNHTDPAFRADTGGIGDMGDSHGRPSTEPTSDRQQILDRMVAAGFSLEEIEAAGLLPAVSTDRTVATLVADALTELQRGNPGSHRTWAPYLRILKDGLPDVCPCPCEACATGPCLCSDGHHAGCTPPEEEKDLDCGARYGGAGGRGVDSIVRKDIDDLAWWARRRALKRTVARNAKRAAAGDPPHLSDGRGAAEAAIQGCRWLFNWLIDNEVTDKNPALKVELPSRQERPARSLEAAELLEVYRTAVTTGQDPDLDGLLLRHQLIHAVRRGGLLGATAGGVDAAAVNLTYWDPKRQTHRTRPSTRAHIAHLLAHVLERGPRVPAPADAPDHLRRTGLPAIGDKDPLFYRRPVDTFDPDGYFVSRETRPVTRKHVEALFTRIKRHLPWARRQQLRPHDLRHTSARLVYRASDEQMARLHLAHDAGSTTDHYLAEHFEQLAKLKEALFSADAAEDDDQTHPRETDDPTDA